LDFSPKQSGALTYSLVVRDSARVSTTEPLPIVVEKENELRILVLASYPTFELQHLKRFLTDHNHRMVLRYQVSKNVFRYEFNNHERIAADRITPALLREFDLLIADEATIEGLGTPVAIQLTQAVRAGLGLITIGYPTRRRGQSSLFPFKGVAVQRDTAVLQISTESKTLAARPFRIVPSERITPLLENKGGLLTGVSSMGSGKIGFQLLTDTYRLALVGNSIAYSFVWTPFIEQVARPLDQPATIAIASAFPIYENEPIEIRLISLQEQPDLSADGISIPLREDALVDNFWHGRIWMEEPGWHALTANGIEQSYFVAEPGKWEALAAANRIRFNRLASQSTSAPTRLAAREWSDISLEYAFLLFLLAAGFLWLAPKL
jgi:hypothetical protein